MFLHGLISSSLAIGGFMIRPSNLKTDWLENRRSIWACKDVFETLLTHALLFSSSRPADISLQYICSKTTSQGKLRKAIREFFDLGVSLSVFVNVSRQNYGNYDAEKRHVQDWPTARRSYAGCSTFDNGSTNKGICTAAINQFKTTAFSSYIGS
jgi:hypothetical protein